MDKSSSTFSPLVNVNLSAEKVLRRNDPSNKKKSFLDERTLLQIREWATEKENHRLWYDDEQRMLYQRGLNDMARERNWPCSTIYIHRVVEGDIYGSLASLWQDLWQGRYESQRIREEIGLCLDRPEPQRPRPMIWCLQERRAMEAYVILEEWRQLWENPQLSWSQMIFRDLDERGALHCRFQGEELSPVTSAGLEGYAQRKRKGGK